MGVMVSEYQGMVVENGAPINCWKGNEGLGSLGWIAKAVARSRIFRDQCIFGFVFLCQGRKSIPGKPASSNDEWQEGQRGTKLSW